MKSDLNDLKKLTLDLIKNGAAAVNETQSGLIRKIYGNEEVENDTDYEDTSLAVIQPVSTPVKKDFPTRNDNYVFAETVEEEETLKLEQKEIEMIKKSLEKNKGRRKAAADELGISERTLYRKIKQFDL
jgi:transcriptional regulator with PAS, ATPase and Fis domain